MYIRYGTYLEAIEKISKIPTMKPLKLKDLKLSRSVEQRAQREMKELNFEGSIVDYICWIDLLYYVVSSQVKNPGEYSDFFKERGWYPSIGTPIKRLVLKDSSYVEKAYLMFVDNKENCKFYIRLLKETIIESIKDEEEMDELERHLT